MDLRDLPQLAALMMRADRGDPAGDASVPWLMLAARRTKEIFVRGGSAEELILANQPDGFKYLRRKMR